MKYLNYLPLKLFNRIKALKHSRYKSAPGSETGRFGYLSKFYSIYGKVTIN